MSNKFTAQDLIKYQILLDFCESEEIDLEVLNSIKTSDDLYVVFDQVTDGFEDSLYDIECELRETGEPCNLLPMNWSRHYEVDRVVKQIMGKWVSWDYYYGGGKYGEPHAYDWISDAKIVEVESEKEVIVIERVFVENTNDTDEDE